MPAAGPGYLDARSGSVARPPKSRTARNRAAATGRASAERIAVYGRLSMMTKRSTSKERQTETCEELPRVRAGVYDPAVDRYEDFESVSGYQVGTRRPEYERLLDAVVAGRYDVIVVYRLDRITRRVAELAKLLALLMKHNVALVSATEPIDTGTELGKMLVFIVGVIAEMESNNTGERMASAQSYLTRNGRYRGGQVPFGFREASTRAEGGHYYRQEPAEVALIVWAIDQILANKTMMGIATAWNVQGIETPRARTMREGWERRGERAAEAGEAFDEPAPATGKAWTATTVRYLLTNPILMGCGTFGEDVVRDDDGEPLEIAPPILDAAAFGHLVARVAERGKGGRGLVRGPANSILGGIARCGSCGRPMSSNGKHYSCRGFNDPKGVTPRVACAGVAIEKERLDSFVLGWLTKRLSDRKIQAAAQALRDAEPEVLTDVHAERRGEILAQLARLREDRKLGLYDGADDYEEYKAETLGLKAELADKAAPLPVHDELRTLLAEPVTKESLLAKDVPELRRFLLAVLGELVVEKGQRGRRRPVDERVRIALVATLAPPAPAP